MKFDALDIDVSKSTMIDLDEKLKAMGESFTSTVKSVDGIFSGAIDEALDCLRMSDELESYPPFPNRFGPGPRPFMPYEAIYEMYSPEHAITITTSLFENVSSFFKGDITAEDMIDNIIDDCSINRPYYNVRPNLSPSLLDMVIPSSNELIHRSIDLIAPPSITTLAIDCYLDFSDYIQGNITVEELANRLSENAVETVDPLGVSMTELVRGIRNESTVGLTGLDTGTLIGTVVGGVVGCAVASEAYAIGIELGLEGHEILGGQAEEMASAVVDSLARLEPEQIEYVRVAFNDFFQQNNLPISV